MSIAMRDLGTFGTRTTSTMKNALNLSVLLLLLAAAATPTEGQYDAWDQYDVSDLFSRSACEFAMELFKGASKENENMVISPTSVSMVLSLLQQGARGNTAAELDELLGVKAETTRSGYANVTLGMKVNDFVTMNGIELRGYKGMQLWGLQSKKNGNAAVEWGSRAYIKPGFTILEHFKADILEAFQAEVEELNFSRDAPQVIADYINQWAGKCTHDQIKEVIQPDMIRADTIMLLVNVIYFKGKWLHRFRVKHTKMDTFETSPGKTVTANYLCQKNKFFTGRNLTLGIKWIELPFEGAKYSMIIVLPTQRHGLEEILQKMKGEDLMNIISYSDTADVRLKLPKFKIKGTYALVEILKRLGLRDVFTEASNLQGMTPEPVHVSDAIHQANIEIDETGGTAFASTILTISRKLILSETFTVDQPFLFFVIDAHSRIPLFAGKIIDPTAS